MSPLPPRGARFHMPAEWQAHARCWMAWPCRTEIWEEALEAARHAYAAVARAVRRFEPVSMLARPEEAEQAAVLCGPQVEIVPAALDDSWMRDSGPTFVVDDRGEVAGVDWRFNAWGGKYASYEHDAAVAGFVLERLGLRRFAAPLVLEGGSIHVDGQGSLLTTEQCLLNPNRNPSLDRAAIEERLAAALGVSNFIWLGGGLQDDETDGHVDNVACFAAPGVVLALSSDDPDDANYAVLQDNVARLRAARDAAGRSFEVITIEQPAARWHADVRLSLSYINFYIANGGIVMPSFDDPLRDAAAFATLREVFRGREIVQLPALDIVRGGGGIHCITQQQPAASPQTGPEMGPEVG